MVNNLIDQVKKERFRQAFTRGDNSIFRRGKRDPDTIRGSCPDIQPAQPSPTPREKRKLNIFLLDAVKSRNKGGVEAALNNGADPNAVDDLGYSALDRATRAGFLEIAELLKKNGATW